MKPFNSLSNKGQHKRVDDLLKKYGTNGDSVKVITQLLDAAQLSSKDKDTWTVLRERWIGFGYL